MTTKRDKRGREAGAPANLTQQPTKEQEGRDNAMSGGGAGQQLSSWSSSLPYPDVVVMGKNDNKNDDNKAQREGEGGWGPGQLDATTNQGKRGAPANLTHQLTEEKEGRNGATSGGGAGQRRNTRGRRVAGAMVNATPTSGGGAGR